jgi:hypothetical protein
LPIETRGFERIDMNVAHQAGVILRGRVGSA